MYKQILVAVDDSKTSHQALNEAMKLAKEGGAKIRLIYVADEQYQNFSGIAFDYMAYDEAVKKYGDDVLKKMGDVVKKSNIPCDTLLIQLKAFQGRIEEAIVEAANDWSADLIVIGTHGRRGFHHFLMGSVAEGVIRIATVPVLLIRGTESE